MRKFYEFGGFEGSGGPGKHITLADEQAFAGLTKEGYAPGMTKRELITTQVFNGIVSSSCSFESDGKKLNTIEDLADWSVCAADAIINALNK